jgi:hypothetical protein
MSSTETASEETTQPPICGWTDIAAEASKAIQQSVTVRTAQRYAEPGKDNRLPVWIWPNGRVYLMPEELELWKRAWLRRRPTGGRMPGKVNHSGQNHRA